MKSKLPIIGYLLIIVLTAGCTCSKKLGTKCSVYFDFNVPDVDLTLKNLDDGSIINAFGHKIEVKLFIREKRSRSKYEIIAQKPGCNDHIEIRKLKKDKRYYISICN